VKRVLRAGAGSEPWLTTMRSSVWSQKPFVSPESSSVEVGYAGETNSSSAPARMFAKAAR
jgi:hypothetical protein